MYAQLESRLLTDTRAAVLLENFQRCITSDVVLPLAVQDFKKSFTSQVEALEKSTGTILDAIGLRDIAVEVLESLTTPVDVNALQQFFGNSTWKSGFDSCRVITKQTLRDRYLEDEVDKDSFGAPTSFDPLADLITDAEFKQGSPANEPPNVKLREQFRLCRPNGIAFITDAADWDSNTNTWENAADRAAEYLGLPYNEGEALVMLRIRSDAISNWSVMRRPTVFDALDHWWWICWPNDPTNCGHTLDLAGLVGGTPILRQGGLEWVIDDQSVNSSGGKVVAFELGATKNNTHAGDTSMLWKDFHGQLKPNGLN